MWQNPHNADCAFKGKLIKNFPVLLNDKWFANSRLHAYTMQNWRNMKKVSIVILLLITAIISVILFKNVSLSVLIIIVALFWPSIKDITIVLTCMSLLIITYAFSNTIFVYPIRYFVRNSPDFRGTILIAREGEILYQASTEKSFDYQYLCASLAKQITAELIMHEHAKNNIILHKSANDYLPKKYKTDKRITVHHLLSHTSGIQKNKGTKFPPGTKYEYSNYGYILLRYVLENVTKKDYPILAQKLFDKLGMKNSYLIDQNTYKKMAEKHPKFLPSFSIRKGNRKNMGEKLTWRTEKNGKHVIFIGNSCGGLVSTVEDLNIWNRNLHGGKLLPQEQYKIMTSPKIKSDFPSGEAGYGIYSRPKEQYNIGYVDGYKATLSYFPDYKITLVILENSTYHNLSKDFRLHIAIRNTIRWWAKIRTMFRNLKLYIH